MEVALLCGHRCFRIGNAGEVGRECSDLQCWLQAPSIVVFQRKKISRANRSLQTFLMLAYTSSAGLAPSRGACTLATGLNDHQCTISELVPNC